MEGVRATTQEHQGHEYTGREMHRLAREFSGDLGDLARWPWRTYWDFVRKIPYSDDVNLTLVNDHEIISRPKYLLSGVFPGLDCKKKSISLAAHCWANRMPYKFIAAIENGGEQVHHVFPIVLDGGKWTIADATFPHFIYGAGKPSLTYAEELMP